MQLVSGRKQNSFNISHKNVSQQTVWSERLVGGGGGGVVTHVFLETADQYDVLISIYY